MPLGLGSYSVCNTVQLTSSSGRLTYTHSSVPGCGGGVPGGASGSGSGSGSGVLAFFPDLGRLGDFAPEPVKSKTRMAFYICY